MVNRGVLDTIRAQMNSRFPERSIPSFGDAAPDSFVMFAYLEAAVKFPLPYTDTQRPLLFRDATGKETPVRAFGVQGDTPPHVRIQAGVLYREASARVEAESFAIDLCVDRSESQLLVARRATSRREHM